MTAILSTTALAEPKPRATPDVAQRAAHTYAKGLYGGKWRADFVRHNSKGDAHVVVRSDSKLRTVFGGKAQGHIFVNADGDVRQRHMRPGIVPRIMDRIWRSRAMRAVRTNPKVITVLSAVGATFVANKLGMSYQDALMVILPVTTAVFVGEVRTERKLNAAAETMTDKMMEAEAARGGMPVRATAAMQSMEESVASRAAPPPKKTRAEVLAEVRKLIGLKK